MGIRVAINGFGRIGRAVMRASLSYRDIEIVAINDLAPAPMLHYLLSKDSVHGPFGAQLQLLENGLEVAGRPVAVLNETKPGEVDFSPYGTDVVLECTGRFLTTPEVAHHLAKGVKKVIISAPATDETPTYVLGVNASFYQGEAIISNASCTTNCLAPLAKIIDEEFGIQMGLMTTIHSYTNDQNLLDVAHRDFRRARAAATNIIPTTTGAARAIGRVLPRLEGRLHGQSVRVPVPDVSMIDLNVVTEQPVTADELNTVVCDRIERDFQGLVAIDRSYGVSQDFIGCSASAIFVPDLTQSIGDHLVKVMAWYDNEWGYANRLLEMALHITHFNKESR